eukprot:scaffold8183_cov248-Pinguiococcus_pyrenoidosus.AAC.2
MGEVQDQLSGRLASDSLERLVADALENTFQQRAAADALAADSLLSQVRESHIRPLQEQIAETEARTEQWHQVIQSRAPFESVAALRDVVVQLKDRQATIERIVQENPPFEMLRKEFEQDRRRSGKLAAEMRDLIYHVTAQSRALTEDVRSEFSARLEQLKKYVQRVRPNQKGETGRHQRKSAETDGEEKHEKSLRADRSGVRSAPSSRSSSDEMPEFPEEITARSSAKAQAYQLAGHNRKVQELLQRFESIIASEAERPHGRAADRLYTAPGSFESSPKASGQQRDLYAKLKLPLPDVPQMTFDPPGPPDGSLSMSQ